MIDQHGAPDFSAPAADMAADYVYRAPALFGYGGFSPDSRAGFLAAAVKEIPRIMERYDPARGAFVPYLVSVVKLNAQGWARDAAKRSSAEAGLARCFAPDMAEAAAAAYEADTEYGGAPGLPGPCAPVPADTLVVLVLKAACDVTGRHVEAAAAAAGVSRETLSALVEQTRESLAKKSEARRKLCESRNRAFFFKSRCRAELERMPPECARYSAVKKQFLYHARLYAQRNEMLRTSRAAAPSNRFIGEMLGIETRRVSRMIRRAEAAFGAGSRGAPESGQ